MENYLPIILGFCIVTVGAFVFGVQVGESNLMKKLAPSIKDEDTPKPQPQTNQATAKPTNTAPPQNEIPRTWRMKELEDEDGTQVFSWEKV